MAPRRPDRGSEARWGEEGTLLIELTDDGVGDITHDRVSMHPDESNRLALIGRARKALDDAEAALLACGYVDISARRTGEQS